jgi:hypothetical protein
VETQQVEIIGRNYLVSALVRDGLEVARPERDRDLDLIAYLDLEEAGGRFVACPIQMKAATERSFSLDRKYERFPSLLFAFLWRVHVPSETVAYALSYPEALQIAQAMRWTETASWRTGRYTSTKPGKQLQTLLEPFRVQDGGWKRRLLEVACGEAG